LRVSFSGADLPGPENGRLAFCRAPPASFALPAGGRGAGRRPSAGSKRLGRGRGRWVGRPLPSARVLPSPPRPGKGVGPPSFHPALRPAGPGVGRGLPGPVAAAGVAPKVELIQSISKPEGSVHHIELRPAGRGSVPAIGRTAPSISLPGVTQRASEAPGSGGTRERRDGVAEGGVAGQAEIRLFRLRRTARFCGNRRPPAIGGEPVKVGPSVLDLAADELRSPLVLPGRRERCGEGSPPASSRGSAIGGPG